jgi:transposase
MTETETKWMGRVAGWKSSGQSAEEYCVGLGIQASTLRWWSSRLRRLSASGAKKGEKTSPGPRVAMVRLVAKPKCEDRALMIRVGGAQVEVRSGFDRALLRELVEALGDPT